MADSFSTRDQLHVDGNTYTYASLAKLGRQFDIARLPYSLKILLENLLRHEDGGITVGAEHIRAVASWDPAAEPATEKAAVTEPAKEEAAQEAAPLPEKKKKSRKAKAEPQPVEPAQPVAAPAESPVVGQADLTLEQLRPAGDAAVPDAPASSDKPVTAP